MSLSVFYRVIQCNPKFHYHSNYNESFYRDKNSYDIGNNFSTYEEAVKRIEELTENDWCTEYFIRKVYRHAGE